MNLKINEVLALVYSDLFDYPLTREELKWWSPVGGEQGLGMDLQRYKRNISFKNGFYFLKRREKLMRLRRQREKISKMKLAKAVKHVKLIKKIPTIEGIFLTGSVALGNAKKESDIDLMIIARPGTMWLTRLGVLWELKTRRILRGGSQIEDRICPNIFLDTNHLEIKNKNLYTAHEVLQVKCLFDRSHVEQQWRVKNSWVESFLPGAYGKIKLKRQGFRGKNEKIPFLYLLEGLAFLLQYLYMRKKITNERVGWGFAFFHPIDLSKEIVKKYEGRVKKYLA